MRIVVTLLALLTFQAHAATTTQFCSSVGKYVTAADVCGASNNLDCCPPNLSNENSGANLDSVSFDGDVMTTVGEGTVYACARTSATSVRTCAQIQAGTGCADTSSKAASVGVVSFDSTDNFSGLSASTEYAIDYCHPFDGRPLDEVVSTNPVTTLAGGGGGGGDLTGSVYVVDSASGSDSNDGLSVANAWQTIAKVNNNVTALGSKVCLLDDSVFINAELVIDWSGEGSDRARVGTCYVDTGDGNKLRWYEDGTGTGRGAKAEFSATSGGQGSAVDLRGSDYVTISSIRIDGEDQAFTLDSASSPQNYGHGIYADDFQSDYILIQNTDIVRTQNSGIRMGGGSTNWHVKNVTIDVVGHLWQDGVSDTGDSFQMRNEASNLLLENSTFDAGGHGVIQIHGNNVVIRYNTFKNDWCVKVGSPFCGAWPRGQRIAEFRTTYTPLNGDWLIEANSFDGVGLSVNDAETASQTSPYYKFNTRDSILRYNDHTSTDTDGFRHAVDMIAGNTGGRQIVDNRIYGNHFQAVADTGNNGVMVQHTTNQAQSSTYRSARNTWKNNRVPQTGGSHRFAWFQLTYRDDTNDEFDGNAFIDNCIEESTFVAEQTNGVGIISLALAETNHPNNFSDNQENEACTADDQGANLAETTDSGTGSTITVDDARYFFDGLTIELGDTDEVVAADVLDVNGDTCTVTSINYSTNQITCSESFTWASGEAVNRDGDETPRHGIPNDITPGDPD